MLGERYDLMKAEVELRERRLQTEEKSRLYDRIALEIAPQLNKADALLQQSREHPEEANALLSQVCVISAYIKRRANLILLGEEKATVAARELESCLREMSMQISHRIYAQLQEKSDLQAIGKGYEGVCRDAVQIQGKRIRRRL